MIQELTLQNFKSFGEPRLPRGRIRIDPWGGAVLKLGPLSLIIGTNASGKSNLRDGLRFIHGISRGYMLTDIIGEKYVEGGVLQWKGIRGGVREVVTRNGGGMKNQFTIQVSTAPDEPGTGMTKYSITVDVGKPSEAPVVVDESLTSRNDKCIFEIKASTGPGQTEVNTYHGRFRSDLALRNDRPAITQLPEHDRCLENVRQECNAFLKTISSMRFLDVDPNSVRRPSYKGQTILGDKGENLSSVLLETCKNPASKEALIEWIRELTPLDVVDLEFPEVSLGGQVQLQLVEGGGRKISAESASDGALRFLAYAGAMLGTEPAKFYFFEELENGIHPNRAHLLVNLLQKATRGSRIQVVGTTHSPALLSFLDHDALKDASLVYRSGGVSQIKNLRDLRDLWKLPTGTRAGELLGSGWFENAVSFLEAEGEA